MEEACADYGRSLGTAFQLVDDLLDYEGDALSMGKTVGDDLREGKPTLPLLLAMAKCTQDERLIIRQAIQQGCTTGLNDILAIVRRTGALQSTRDAAQAEVDKACAALCAFPETAARNALIELATRSVQRNF